MKPNSQTQETLDRWLPYRRALSQPALRLFCLPYAGGSAAAYRKWHEHMPGEVEVCAVQLPGRERRMREPAFTRMRLVVEELAHVLGPLFDIPFAFVGHSMGGKIVFELARHLRQTGGAQPVHLFISASRAPHMADKPSIHALPEAEFFAALRKLGGTPEQILENEELMQLLTPLLRADFELIGTYRFEADEPLDCNMSAFAGLADLEAPAETMQGWGEHTRGSFRHQTFPGDHFFIHKQQRPFLTELLRDLRPYL